METIFRGGTILTIDGQHRVLGGDVAIRDGAIAHYLAAAARTASVPERNYLHTQAARLSTGSESGGV